MHTYTALPKGGGEHVDTFLNRGCRHIKMVIMGRIKMLPGKEVDGILQAFVKVLVKNDVRFVLENILVAKALPGCELVKKLSRIL